jgi:hypothetical protein
MVSAKFRRRNERDLNATLLKITKEEKSAGQPIRIFGDSIKTNLKEMRWDIMDWINL